MTDPTDPTDPNARDAPSRRRVLRLGLRHAAAIAAAAALPTLPARAATPAPRRLSMRHTHTGESLDLVYAVGDRYDASALGTLDHFLRDHYTGEVGRIDPRLHDLLSDLHRTLGADEPLQVISAYRCARTNERLRRRGGGGVASRSLHLDGRAIDIRVAGVPLVDVRDAALSLQRGGVGYYPGSQFVHVDTGRIRRW